MLVTLLFSTLMNVHARSRTVADRITTRSACALLLAMASPAEDEANRLEDARELVAEFAQKLPIVSEPLAGTKAVRLMTSEGGDRDSRNSARLLFGLRTRQVELARVGDGGDVIRSLAELQQIVRPYHEADRKKTARDFRRYLKIPLGGVAAVGAGLFFANPGLITAGAFTALLPVRHMIETLTDFRDHLLEATSWFQRVGLASQPGDWVHVSAYDESVEKFVDIIAFVDADGQARLITFVSKD